MQWRGVGRGEQGERADSQSEDGVQVSERPVRGHVTHPVGMILSVPLGEDGGLNHEAASEGGAEASDSRRDKSELRGERWTNLLFASKRKNLALHELPSTSRAKR